MEAPQEILTEEHYAAATKEIDLTMRDAALHRDDLGVDTDALALLFSPLD